MCNGDAFLSANGFKNKRPFTLPFTDAANTTDGFDHIPTRGGVYCLSVSNEPVSVRDVRRKYRSSSLFKALRQLDAASEAFFSCVGFGKDWGWGHCELAKERLRRLDKIKFRENGQLVCPILYFGRTNSLQTRMRHLLCLEHTVNHPFWAVLNAGWKFTLSYRVVDDEKDAEAKLKVNYKRKHGDELPPLMQR